MYLSSPFSLARTLVSRIQRLLLLALCCAGFIGHAYAVSTTLVIAEIYGGGGNSSATYSNDFVAIFNVSTSPVDVNGWSIQYASAAGSTWSVGTLANTSTLIPAGGYFLVKMASGGAIGGSIGSADATNTINMSASAGKLALCNSTTALTGTCPTGASIVDFVGFGTTASCSEGGSTAPGASNTTSVRRKDNGCADTDANANDFEVANPPTPRGSATTPNPCGGTTAPSISAQPQSRTNNGGTTATFTVTVSGSSLNYLWKKNGNTIADINALGTTTGILSITNVQAGNAGSYSVEITNSAGAVTSSIVTLTVIDPGINTQPSSRTNLLGDVANFFASAGGTAVTYQWRKNGSNISGSTNQTLNVTNLALSDAAAYTVVVSNSLGSSITSSNAVLTILPTPPTRLARWDFNNTNVTVTGPILASEGSGLATLIGTTATYQSGTFSDPAAPALLNNSAWNTASYATNNALNNKTRGVQFDLSTSNYTGLWMVWEEQHSSSSSKYTRLQYSIDGVNFTDTTNVFTTDVATTFFFRYADLSSIPELNNQTNISLRLVGEWESTALGTTNTNYVATASGTGTSYASNGTIRYDLVSVYATSALIGPQLSASLSDGNVTLSWSTNASGFDLEQKPDLNAANWSTVGQNPNQNNGTNVVTLPASGKAFFRLHKP